MTGVQTCALPISTRLPSLLPRLPCSGGSCCTMKCKSSEHRNHRRERAHHTHSAPPAPRSPLPALAAPASCRHLASAEGRTLALDSRRSRFSSFLFFNKFIYFILSSSWLHWVFIAARGLSLVVASGGYSSLWCTGFSLQWLLLLGARVLGAWASVVVACGLSSCGSWALERRLSSCGTQA